MNILLIFLLILSKLFHLLWKEERTDPTIQKQVYLGKKRKKKKSYLSFSPIMWTPDSQTQIARSCLALVIQLVFV